MSSAITASLIPAAAPPRFLDRLHQAALQHFGRPEPALRCVEWTKRFILFFQKKHPSEMGAAEAGSPARSICLAK
jgi:hypothetical protein